MTPIYNHDNVHGYYQFYLFGMQGKDCNGHGSHCAGTVGGNLYGVAKNCNLFACRTLSCSGSGSKSNSIAGTYMHGVIMVHAYAACCDLGFKLHR